MAPSLRDLIDFLLAEIALCGDQGASPSDILKFIDTFYARFAQDGPERNHSVDKRFKDKVWTWLTKNPEISVGNNREGNHLRLQDVVGVSDDGSSTKAEVPTMPSGPVRVFVSKERTWLAITGHEPDETKVLPTEFALLSIIASRKHNGIVQTDLVKVSGQDKRSVPKRTDALHQKGYIEKRAIQIKAARTSLCTLRRFLTAENAIQTNDDNELANAKRRMIDFNEFTGKLFDILREYKLISRNDLKAKLGFADHWHWRILSRALRKFERIGVLKRVKALSQYAHTLKKFHPCVMLIREPTEKDIQMFHEFSRGILANLDQEDNVELDDELEQEDSTQASQEAAPNTTLMKREQQVEDAGRILPCWSPDRNIHNLIYETIDKAGTAGLTNQGIISNGFGYYYRRPLENAISRLTDCWQLSQPLHLRHLAIVRDTALERTITHYVHYTALSFQELVNAGDALWEAVEFRPKDAKDDKIRPPPVDAMPQLDQYALPLERPGKEVLKRGQATLLECILVAQPPDYNCSSRDPVAVKQDDGSYAIQQKLKGSAGVGMSPLRHKPTPRIKEECLEVSDEETLEVKPVNGRRKKNDPDRFKGMSEKERMEAMGYDETWTDYSVLLIERPEPGVYVTPRGRRRAAGNRQGRPRVSRLAVFKSPKLSSFPWFQSESVDPDADTAIRPRSTPQTPRLAETPTPMEADEDTPLGSPGPAASKKTQGGKRSRQKRDSDADSSIRGARKQRRVNEKPSEEVASSVDANSNPSVQSEEGDSGIRTSSVILEQRTATKRKRAVSPKGDQPVPEVAEPSNPDTVATSRSPRNKSFRTPTSEVSPSPKKLRATNTLRKWLATSQTPKRASENHTNAGLAADSPTASNGVDNTQSIERAVSTESERIDIESTDAQPAPDQVDVPSPTMSQLSPEKEKVNSPSQHNNDTRRIRAGKGGSVAVLRRQIVLEIIDRAGGAYPMGTELWYPFMTAWAKTRYKEIPDLRTVRTVVKGLVDSGRVRQLTFSGRDNKGVMVTKNIVYQAEMQADDPLIEDLQKKMLAADRYYFPPNVEIDPEIKKNGSKRKKIAGNEGRHHTEFPVLPDALTVQLHKKPASVVAIEKRRDVAMRKELLEQLAMEEDFDQFSGSEIVRLMTFRRRAGKNGAQGLTSISRPHSMSKEDRQSRRRHALAGLASIRKMRRLWSSLAPYSMLMNTRSTFLSTTGTFSTEAGIPALQAAKDRAKAAARKQVLIPATEMPHSLEDILKTRRNTFDYSTSDDPRARQFFHETNTISRWELENEDLLARRSSDITFINQTVQNMESSGIESGIRFDFDESFGHFMAPRLSVTTRQRRRRSEAASVAPPNRRLAKWDESMAGDNTKVILSSQDINNNRNTSSKRNRSQMPPEMVRRIMVAFAVVRSLAGGSDARNVDWSLMCHCFPDMEQSVVVERGRLILNKYRLQITKMQSDFHERFLEAYAKDEVPPINYDDLYNYDWEGVVDWASHHLDLPKSEKVPDLPATREQLDSMFDVREEPPNAVDELYHLSQSITLSRKRALAAGVPFAMPLSHKAGRCQLRKAELARLEVAKTWVRANVVTPEETYRPMEARQSLERLGEPMVHQALQSLVTERALNMSNRGRITPGRNYDVTEYFMLAISKRRAIESTQLRRAHRFKTEILDPVLRDQGYVEIDWNAEDGDILVIMNMLWAGRVLLKPRDPPRDKYGLTEGGYLTRQLDKTKLRFTVDVWPTDTYVFGNPIQEKTSALKPPRLAEEVDSVTSLPAKIPLWYDIHGDFVRVLWDLTVAAVVGCVATRPGISAHDIAGMVKPTMGGWEVQLLLEWMKEVGVVKLDWTGRAEHDENEPGWRVDEWWYMVLG
ncbi:putative TFIIIC transcription initiation factor complex subunits Tfc3 [Aspergillus saccharolyticus JOP 1030-1]|uniref:Uncharacterized protein n=1 Tax=Aspergillus saccharolyticus JOP 1030-1 TaxID=1450539 RepID=A0A318Z2V9_9EURO|nr:hypothetical protein BP01DRAFT_327355 [Aspergillus saccharolyticus JOP 1030-1]PYH41605.1 hypothetical protein BP01DRAFT_327355 [Aspergillus saccharolyticus JOP 1030-1]